MKKCLFLGYKRDKTSIISYVKKKGWLVKEWGNKIPNKQFYDYDLIISFGYTKIINKSILAKCKRPILNLHISFLPYNRGAHPNFWSFIENTPKGVSIHEMNSIVDKGNIVYRKKINFKSNINSFKSSYKILKYEIEKLFIKNIKSILQNNYKVKKISNLGTYHSKNELPEFMKNWNVKISEAKKNLLN